MTDFSSQNEFQQGVQKFYTSSMTSSNSNRTFISPNLKFGIRHIGLVYPRYQHLIDMLLGVFEILARLAQSHRNHMLPTSFCFIKNINCSKCFHYVIRSSTKLAINIILHNRTILESRCQCCQLYRKNIPYEPQGVEVSLERSWFD